MKVLITVASLEPSYGGPAYSVPRLAAELAGLGIEVGLWTPDQSVAAILRDHPHSSVEPLLGTEVEALSRFGKPDIIHDNGLWRPHNHRLATLAENRGIHRVVSTRGMLEPWALQHKRWKKRLAWFFYQQRDLRRTSCVHATAEAEAKSVKNLALGVPLVIIPNGVDPPNENSPFARRRTRDSPRTALFLGRIYPVKGLPMLIEAWARVRPKGWILRIAGPDEAGHQQEVRGLANAAGLSDVVFFLGPLRGRQKTDALSQAELFVLPTHSENFGVAIGEALAHGLPVLTTTGAPWPSLPASGCGWWVEPTVNGIAEGLRIATSLPAERLAAMGTRGRKYVSKEFAWSGIAQKMLSTYCGLLSVPPTSTGRCFGSASTAISE